MADPGLNRIFAPKSIAVVGASRHEGKIGYEIVKNLVANGYRGSIYPINPKADEILDIRVYPSVGAVPGPVDLAVIVVPAALAIPAVEECGKKGVKGLVVITAGFREIGGGGRGGGGGGIGGWRRRRGGGGGGGRRGGGET